SPSNTFVTNDLLPGDVITVNVETGGCPAADKDLSPNVIEFYNSFTPNSDGLNDVFLPGVDLTIVNRWGQELYHGNDGWDGSFGDESVSQGTYFFLVKLTDEEGNENEVKGSVTLIR
ncbi:MAG TPA: gliding motility-associated C-terminal domain-containing protein, partial [Bacteroidales bacterium]|nr:gliding motility-associated C-terminal domain-containing protein [Bacteroidales bacterium]